MTRIPMSDTRAGERLRDRWLDPPDDEPEVDPEATCYYCGGLLSEGGHRRCNRIDEEVDVG